MTFSGFLLACAAIGIPALFLRYLEWRSARSDRKAAGLRSANRGQGK